MSSEWIRLTPESEANNDLLLVQIDEWGVQLGAGYLDDDGYLRCAQDVLPMLFTTDELDALARYAPDVKALVEVATAAAEYMSDADLCDADTEWRLGTEVRAALAPFQEASGG